MRRCVLVIDDSDADVALLRSALECDGNRIEIVRYRTASAATTAVAASEPGVIKGIVLDLGLPLIDGAAWLRTLDDDLARLGVPVVLWTGSLRDEAQLRALSPRITRVLRKPIAWSDLRILVRELRTRGAIAA